MRFRLIWLIGFAFSIVGVRGQTPAILWQKDYGGNGIEGLFSVINTTDGGYMLGGYSSSGISGEKSEVSRGAEDYWMVKIDANGNKLWDKTFGGDSTDYLQAMLQTSDGGYILAGYSISGASGDKSDPNFGYWDTWLVKVDENGIKQWDKSYGGAGYKTDGVVSLKETDDGGFLLWIVSGSDSNGVKTCNSRGMSDYWLVKINSTGSILWQMDIGGTSIDHILSVDQTLDGGYILGGFSMSGVGGDKTTVNYGGFDYWVVKLDASRNIEWQKEYGGNQFEHLMSIKQLPDSGYIIGGFSASGESGNKTVACRGNYDYWVIRTDSKGEIIWQKVYGGSDSEEMRGGIRIVDGGYLLVGFSQSGISGEKSEPHRGQGDYWIVKTDTSGEKLWDITLGGDSIEYLYTAIEAADGGYILAGWSNSGISCDKMVSSHGNFDFWVVKISSDPEGVKNLNTVETQVTVFPNPANTSAKIVVNSSTILKETYVSVFNEQGQEVSHLPLIGNTAVFEAGNLPSGLYFYSVLEGDMRRVSSGRIMLVRNN